MDHPASQAALPTRECPTQPSGFRKSRKRLFVMAVTLTLLMLLNPQSSRGQAIASAPSQQSTGNIRVISETWQVEFPDRVVFNLAAEASGSIPGRIVEVRLRYRLAGGGAWSYAYPEFTPGRRITAAHHLNTGGAAYLPPGTNLEYHYLLQDSAGNRLLTPTNTLEYTDTRFGWDETRIGPLALYHHDIPASNVRHIAEEVESGLANIQDLLGITSPDPIQGMVYKRRSDAVAAFPHHSRTITEQHVFAGFAFPLKGLFLGVGIDPDLILHESAHLLLHQHMGTAALPIPDWLDEGFASYVEPDSRPYSGRSLAGMGMPLHAMTRTPGKPDDIGMFYLKAESVVAYLIEEHGADRFRAFLDHLRRGRTVDAALTAIYGFDIRGLESRWAEWDGGFNGRPAQDRPSPLVYLDVWLFGGLFLLVMVVVTVRYIISKLRSGGDPEEGLQPWEDPDLIDRT